MWLRGIYPGDGSGGLCVMQQDDRHMPYMDLLLEAQRTEAGSLCVRHTLGMASWWTCASRACISRTT